MSPSLWYWKRAITSKEVPLELAPVTLHWLYWLTNQGALSGYPDVWWSSGAHTVGIWIHGLWWSRKLSQVLLSVGCYIQALAGGWAPCVWDRPRQLGQQWRNCLRLAEHRVRHSVGVCRELLLEWQPNLTGEVHPNSIATSFRIPELECKDCYTVVPQFYKPILRPPLIIRLLHLVPRGNFLC